ncbi:hypothetical protein PPERSA_09757 [Pseudocohnilembus persalinus]|uniref:Uncharacterized protein n=1 Tax=Pseudocohnilembus persalinus TaxID=266149 RepID=A0A0V0QTU6_PSEPJ|nr:hypothetical protein PPERSA_09757 [Pseudocohnilembus persalinus]|eukprot:KRX05617.1 hypothetical protein PPERSA_09757 [Pseudocohnilembus persalinus]
MKLNIFILLLVSIIISFINCAPKQEKSFEGFFKQRQKECKLNQCKHLQEGFNEQCINSCISERCHDDTYKNTEMEVGETFKNQEKEFKNCVKKKHKDCKQLGTLDKCAWHRATKQ